MPNSMLNSNQLAYYQTIAEQYENAYEASKEFLQIAHDLHVQYDADYDEIAEAAYYTENTAQEAERIAQSAKKEIVILSSEEAERRNAAKLANSLAEETMTWQGQGDSTYSDLISKALEALQTVSANADVELSEFEAAFSAAKKKGLLLSAAASSAKLSAVITQLKKVSSLEQRFDATAKEQLLGLEAEINLGRKEIAQAMHAIAKGRPFLQSCIDQYQAITEQLAELKAEDDRSAQELAKLTASLTAVGAEIIPHQNALSSLQAAEVRLQNEYTAAQKEIAQAGRYREDLAAMLLKKQELEQVAIQTNEQERQALEEQSAATLAQAQQELDQMRAAQAEAEAVQLALEQAYQDLCGQAEALKEAIKETAAAKSNATATIEETAQMLENIHAAKGAMRSQSVSILTDTEDILADALEVAKELSRKKTAEGLQLEQNFKELEEQRERAFQELSAARSALLHAKKNTIQAETAQQRTQATVEATQQMQLDQIKQRLRAAQSAVRQADSAIKAIESDLERKQKKSARLEQQLQDLAVSISATQAEYDAMQAKISDLNQKIETESMVNASQRQANMLALWEESEAKRMDALNSHNNIKAAIIRMHKLSAQDKTLTSQLEQLIVAANQKSTECRQESQQVLAELVEQRNALQNDLLNLAQIDAKERETTENTANMLIDTAENIEQDFLEIHANTPPAKYEASIAGAVHIDEELLSAAIPLIPQKAAAEPGLGVFTTEEAPLEATLPDFVEAPRLEEQAEQQAPADFVAAWEFSANHQDAEAQAELLASLGEQGLDATLFSMEESELQLLQLFAEVDSQISAANATAADDAEAPGPTLEQRAEQPAPAEMPTTATADETITPVAIEQVELLSDADLVAPAPLAAAEEAAPALAESDSALHSDIPAEKTPLEILQLEISMMREAIQERTAPIAIPQQLTAGDMSAAIVQQVAANTSAAAAAPLSSEAELSDEIEALRRQLTGTVPLVQVDVQQEAAPEAPPEEAPATENGRVEKIYTKTRHEKRQALQAAEQRKQQLAEKEQQQQEAAAQEKVLQLSSEIETVRKQLQEEELAQQQAQQAEAAEAAQKEALLQKAAAEAKKIAEEEAAIQRKVEQAAAIEQQQRSEREAEEEARLSKLAMELTQKIATATEPTSPAADSTAPAPAADFIDEDMDNDLEEELRRILFPNR